MEEQQKAFGWAARDAEGALSPFTFHRRHEIVGIITAAGKNVYKFKIGDKAGVGYLSGSCKDCGSCKEGYENYCTKAITTSNGVEYDGTTTLGGFSDILVVNENFAVKLPKNMPLEKAGPLLCAGIIVYSPMKHFGLNEAGKHLGVVGLGGLGHLAVKFGKAFGMKVTIISSSSNKEKEAIERLGADSFLVSRDPEQMKAAIGTMDGIINTVSAYHEITPLIFLLKTHGKMVLVGAPIEPLQLSTFFLLQGGKVLAGSNTGGIRDTQEMVNFVAEHNVAVGCGSHPSR